MTEKSFFENKYFVFGSIVCIHLLLVCYAFYPHFKSPKNTSFVGWGDGQKNNFTLLSFVKSPIQKRSILKFDNFNYPYGDYVFSTDNTPLFSVPFRWFCQNMIDISEYTLFAYSIFIFFNIIFCGIGVFILFNKIKTVNVLSWLMAIFLPWLNYQFLRIGAGHYNLSVTSLIVFTLILCINWSQVISVKRRILFLIWFVALGFIGFLVHGYYVAIIPVFISFFLASFGVLKRKEVSGKISILYAFLVPIVTLAMAMFVLISTDNYYHLRQEFARGYDWMEWKTNFSMLFSKYSFQQFYFPLWIDKPNDDIELKAYLGNIGLFSSAFLFIGAVFNRKFRQTLGLIQKEYFYEPVNLSLTFAGLILLSMSFGENYYPLMQSLKFSFPISLHEPKDLVYLFVLIILILILFYSIFKFWNSKNSLYNKEHQDYFPNVNKKKTILFFVISAMVIYIMFGHYRIGKITNISNPFWMLHHFTKKVEQFRCLVRFSWPFFWVFYAWLLFTLSALYLRFSKQGKLIMIAFIFLCAVPELMDYTNEAKKSMNTTSSFSKSNLSKFNKLKCSFQNYQAILPFPFYTVGSEDYENTIDENSAWSEFTFQLSIFSKLPLMSCKMSRTPSLFSHEILQWISTDTMSQSLRGKLNSLPILIVVQKDLISDSSQACIPKQVEYPFAYNAYWAGNEFVSRHYLQAIDSIENVLFYKFDLE